MIIDDEALVVIAERHEQQGVLMIQRDVVEDLDPQHHDDDGTIIGVDVVRVRRVCCCFLYTLPSIG